MKNEEKKITSAPETSVPATTRKEKFRFAQREEVIHDTKFETKPVSYLQDCMRRFVRNKASVVAAAIIFVIGLFAIFEPMLDPKNHVSSEDFVNGEFADEKFAGVLPRCEWFAETGFWDGTEKREIDKLRYDLWRFDDSNHPYISEKIDEYFPDLPPALQGNDNYRRYVVRLDTYAVGCKYVYLNRESYDSLVEYEKEKGIYLTEDSIMKPIVDHESYLVEVADRLRGDGVSENNITTIISRLGTYYTQNARIFFKVMPTKNANGTYNDQQWAPLDEDGDGIPEDIYLRDESGNLVYETIHNSEYRVRVDYYDYFTYKNGFKPSFLFGTNLQGKDILLRLSLGARFSLCLGLGITLINFIIGLIWGSISGYYGGRVDLIMERITDIISNIPTIIIMSIASIQLVNNQSLRATLGPAGIVVAAIFIAFIYNGWVGVASTTRMQFYRFKGQEYVLASRTLGAKDRRLIFKHILPNATGTLVTRSVLMIPGVIFSEASLSYLGIINFENSGIYSIGSMLNEGKAAGITNYPHILLFPALIISLLMISFNLFGNGLRDAFNTTLRGSEE